MQAQKEPLSERELDILRLVATGAANKEIARQLVISPNTVKVHMRNIFSKIGVASRTEATLYAISIGLIIPSTNEVQTNGNSFPVIGLDPLEGLSASGPAISDETTPAQSTKSRLKFWQIGLGILTALVLLLTGVAGARLIAQPIQTPTVLVQKPITQEPVMRWSIKAKLPSPRKSMGIAVYENAFYLIGGETSEGIDGATLKYDPVNDTWTTLSNKPTPVTDAYAAQVGGKIYIPGGRLANGQMTDILEVYDPRSDTWQTRTALPVPLSAYSLAAYEGQIFVFGGKTETEYVSTVYSYDPEEDRWNAQSELSSARAYSATAVMDGKIFVIGGFDGKKALTLNEAYFPNRDSAGEEAWETLTPLPSGRYGMGVTNIAGFIFLIGGAGENPRDVIKPITMQYLSISNSWSELDTPPQTIGAFPALLSSGNFLYVMGGETSSGISAESLAYQAIYTISVPIITGGQ